MKYFCHWLCELGNLFFYHSIIFLAKGTIGKNVKPVSSVDSKSGSKKGAEVVIVPLERTLDTLTYMLSFCVNKDIHLPFMESVYVTMYLTKAKNEMKFDEVTKQSQQSA